jgi:hypothetical protein
VTRIGRLERPRELASPPDPGGEAPVWESVGSEVLMHIRSGARWYGGYAFDPSVATVDPRGKRELALDGGRWEAPEWLSGGFEPPGARMRIAARTGQRSAGCSCTVRARRLDLASPGKNLCAPCDSGPIIPVPRRKRCVVLGQGPRGGGLASRRDGALLEDERYYVKPRACRARSGADGGASTSAPLVVSRGRWRASPRSISMS